MANVFYQALCRTHGKFIGPKTTNHNEAYQDEQAHLETYPDHDVDIRITQSFSMKGVETDFDKVQPFSEG